MARAVSDLAKHDAVFILDTGLNTLWSANWIRQSGLQPIHLGARRAIEDAKLAKLIAAATAVEKTSAAAGRILVGRDGGRIA